MPLCGHAELAARQAKCPDDCRAPAAADAKPAARAGVAQSAERRREHPRRSRGCKSLLPLPILLAAAAAAAEAPAQTWRGLAVEPERVCSAYDPRDYAYPAAIEAAIVHALGGVWSPYTEQCFSSAAHTDVEHIVARRQAHVSGMCARPRTERRLFARDMLNLTLASSRVNRAEKGARDLAGWMPRDNYCWTAKRVLVVKRKWRLSVDVREAASMARILRRCAGDFRLRRPACAGRPASGTMARWISSPPPTTP